MSGTMDEINEALSLRRGNRSAGKNNGVKPEPKLQQNAVNCRHSRKKNVHDTQLNTQANCKGNLDHQ